MDLQLQGKRALVTGSTAGIGFASARALPAEGASVIVNGRGQERVDAAIGEILKLHPRANVSGITSDVSNAAGCAKLIQASPASIFWSITWAFSNQSLLKRFRTKIGCSCSRPM